MPGAAFIEKDASAAQIGDLVSTLVARFMAQGALNRSHDAAVSEDQHFLAGMSGGNVIKCRKDPGRC